jgi:hypothetical protein
MFQVELFARLVFKTFTEVALLGTSSGMQMRVKALTFTNRHTFFGSNGHMFSGRNCLTTFTGEHAM